MAYNKFQIEEPAKAQKESNCIRLNDAKIKSQFDNLPVGAVTQTARYVPPHLRGVKLNFILFLFKINKLINVKVKLSKIRTKTKWLATERKNSRHDRKRPKRRRKSEDCTENWKTFVN